MNQSERYLISVGCIIEPIFSIICEVHYAGFVNNRINIFV